MLHPKRTPAALDKTWLQLQHCRLATGWRHPARRGRCGWHSHADLEIVYHPSGRGQSYCADGSQFNYHSDTVIIYPVGMEHDQEMLSDADDWCLQISAPASLQTQLAKPWCIAQLDDDLLRADIRCLTDATAHADALQAAADHARAAALLAALIARRDREGDADPASRHLQEAQHYMSRHFGSIGNLNEVAEYCGIGCDRLRRIFVEQMGIPPKRYLTRLRIQRAQELLRHSNLDLLAIAQQCGFAHERHFSDCFRQHLGCAPGHWRRQAG